MTPHKPGLHNAPLDELIDRARHEVEGRFPAATTLLYRIEELMGPTGGFYHIETLQNQPSSDIRKLASIIDEFEDPDTGLKWVLQTYEEAELDLDDFLHSSVFRERSELLQEQIQHEDPERWERMQEYAGRGADGSTHGERIEDMREIVNSAVAEGEIADATGTRLLREINELERYHEKEESLDEIVG